MGHAIEIKPASPEQSGQLVLQTGEIPASKTPRAAESEYRVLRAPAPASTSQGVDTVLKSLGVTASGSARIAPNNHRARVTASLQWQRG